MIDNRFDSDELSVSFLAWINQELRKMADEQIESERASSVSHRVKSFLSSEFAEAAAFTVCSGISLIAILELIVS